MIVPGRHVAMELKDTSSMAGPIRFELGLMDYEAGCRLDFEEYVIDDLTIEPGIVLDSAIAHYRGLLVAHGVVHEWPDHTSQPGRGRRDSRPFPQEKGLEMRETQCIPLKAAGTQ